MQAPPIFYLRRLIRDLHGRKKRASLSALFILIMGSSPYQLLQQPSAEVACNLCRGAQAVTAIHRRKGGFGWIVGISGANATSTKQRKRATLFLTIVSLPFQREVWRDCKYKWRKLPPPPRTEKARLTQGTLFLMSVEVAGVEPASKQGARRLSTRLVTV